MKFARRLSLFLTSRWMRRLVWLPCLLFGCIVLGATLESNGFRLSMYNQTGQRLANALKTANYGSQNPSSTSSNTNTYTTTSPQAYSSVGTKQTSTGRFPSTQPQPTSQPRIAPTPTFTSTPTPTFVANPTPTFGANPTTYQAATQPTISQPTFSQSGFPQSSQPPRPNGQYPYTNGLAYAQNALVAATYHQAPQGDVLFSQPIPSFQSPGYAPPHAIAPSFNSGTVLPAPISNIASSQSGLQDSSKLTHLANEAQRIGSSDPVQLEATLRQLLALAIHQFQIKQSDDRAELEKAKEALSYWEDAVSERESLMKPIVESHLAQLLKSPDKLNWTFSGSQLLKSQSNQANYQEVLSQLWASHAKQQSEQPSQETLELPSPPMPSVIDADSDSLKRPSLNGLQPLTNKVIEPPLPIAEPSAEANEDLDSLEKPTLVSGDKGSSDIP